MAITTIKELYPFKDYICNKFRKKGIPSEYWEDILQDVWVTCLRYRSHLGKNGYSHLGFLDFMIKRTLSDRAAAFHRKLDTAFIGDLGYDEEDYSPPLKDPNYHSRLWDEVHDTLKHFPRAYAHIYSRDRLHGVAEAYGVSRTTLENDYKLFTWWWSTQ